jgi:hypothetical protein
MIYGAHMGILFNSKEKIPLLVKRPYKVLRPSPMIMLIVVPRMHSAIFFYIRSWSHTKPHTTQIQVFQ